MLLSLSLALGGAVPAMARADENPATLRERLVAPCLGVLPSVSPAEPRLLATHVDLAAGTILARRHSREGANRS